MNLGLFIIFSVACAALGASPVIAQTPAARVIIKYKADSPLLVKAAMPADAKHAVQARALSARTGIPLRAGAGVAERSHVVVADGMTSAALAQRLATEPDVEYAVPDERRRASAAPNDPLYLSGPPIVGMTGGPVAGQWYLRPAAANTPASINADGAWNASLGANVVVAMIDTGVRFDHVDLQAQLLPGYDMIADPVAANDGDGRDADASDPGDFLTANDLQLPEFQGCATQPQSSSWHGTQTAALIGATTNNGVGMASVAPAVKLVPVRVLGKCGGFDSDIIAGMFWAAGIAVPGVPANPHPARVLNMSLGGDGPCTSAYIDAVAQINAAGAVVVAAAGNNAGHALGAPANCPGVIGVAGLRQAGTKVGFSDLGPDVAISAPAGNCVNTATGSPCLYPILSASNSGTTTPVANADGGSIYTDAFNASLGTSFSAPLVSGTAALMLSAQPSLSARRVRDLLQASARPFPTTGGDNGDGTPVLQCTAPQPVGTPQFDQLQCYCTTTTCGAGMLDAAAAVGAANASIAPNYTGLFWNAPANSESGWGINFAHQGDQVFATWFTYDTTGRAWWLSMLATLAAPNTYSGTIVATSGPPFSNFVGPVSSSVVGNGTLAFANTDNATFTYTVNQVTQAKNLTRFNLGTGALPICFYNPTSPNVVGATNYQDLWWVPGGAESGWGINFAQQGDTIFATWYTYDVDGAPLWFTSLATRVPLSNVFNGPIYRTSGPRFDAYNATKLATQQVGTATFTFTDGDHALFTYTVMPGPVTQNKSITRFQFAASGGVICQ